MTDSSHVHWVDERGELERLAGRLESADVIALDTEQDSFYSYFTKVCILQIGAFGEEWIIDTLVLRDFECLTGPFLDPRIPKIFHAGENDVDLLRRQCGLNFVGVFDTMAASSILGYQKTGLAGQLHEQFGIEIEKKYQRSDWRKRPLAQEQIDYAALDVRFLPRLREALLGELEETKRVEESLSDFHRIENVVHDVKEFDPDGYYWQKGVKDLPGKQRSILRSMYVLRDEIARKEDRAPFRVLTEEVLRRLAHDSPRDVKKLTSMRGLSEEFKLRYGQEAIRRIEKARSGPVPEPPKRRSSAEAGSLRLDSKQKECYDRLRAWRLERASDRDVEPGRVISNALLAKVVRATPSSREDLIDIGLEDWRIREYGDSILAVLGEEDAGK